MFGYHIYWSLPSEPCQTVEKAGLHAKKAMLCIWWDCRGPIYYELLPMNDTINSEKYCVQLDILKAAIEEIELINMDLFSIRIMQDRMPQSTRCKN